MSNALSFLETQLSDPAKLITDSALQDQVVDNLIILRDEDPAQFKEIYDFYRVIPQIQTKMLLRETRDALATTHRAAVRIGGTAADAGAFLATLSLNGASGDALHAYTATDDKEPSTPAVYSYERASSVSDQIELFSGDSKRRVIITYTGHQAQEIVVTIIEVLDGVAGKRRSDTNYGQNGPKNKIDTALELVADLYAAYEKAEGDKKDKIKTALAQTLRIVTSDKNLLSNTAPEAYTDKTDYLVPFYKAWAEVNNYEYIPDSPIVSFSANNALLTTNRAQRRQVSLQFAGQGNSYLEDLKYLYAMPDVKDFIDGKIALLQARTRDPNVPKGYYHASYGLNFTQWMRTGRFPNEAYLSSVQVNMPLIALTQMARMLYLRNRGFNPRPEDVKVIGGHSQGIMLALLASQFAEGEEYVQKSDAVLKYMFWEGVRFHQAVHGRTFNYVTPAELESSGYVVDDKHPVPSPMALLRGLTVPKLQKYIDMVNGRLYQDGKKDELIYIALNTSRTNHIVSGPASSLLLLYKTMSEIKKKEGIQGDDVLERSPLEFDMTFLKASGPFHAGSYYVRQPQKLVVDAAREGVDFSDWHIKAPIIHTRSGKLIQGIAGPDLALELAYMQLLDSVNFMATTAHFAGTDVVDVGPGQDILLGTRGNVTGTNARLFAGGTAAGLKELLTTDPKKLPKAVDYLNHRSRVVTLNDGQTLMVDGRAVRFAGRPPVWVGGMTPTTASEDIVVNPTNYGYHIELSGGGQGSAKIFEDKVKAISKRLTPGEFITINLIKSFPYVWSFLETAKKLVKEGYPIGGLTIAAGMPNLQEAKDLWSELNDLTIWNISVKPGDEKALDTLKEMAKAMPTRTIVAQVELGMAGGHHSWKDRELIRKFYRDLREYDNIVLMIGGGVRNQEDAARYMDGSWNEEGVPMPFDGVFVGTIMMDTDEARTNSGSREIMREAPGVGPDAGFSAVNYRLAGVMHDTAGDNEPIHYAATEAAAIFKWLGEKLADYDGATDPSVQAINDEGKRNEKIEKNKKAREAAIAKFLKEERSTIIAALNRTQKPYFVPQELLDEGKDKLTDMTYSQVAYRLVELLRSSGDWLDFSHRDYVGRWLDYLTTKLARVKGKAKAETVDFFATTQPFADAPHIKNYPQLQDDPAAMVGKFFDAYPELKDMKMDARDVGNFSMLANPGVFRMKPLNYVTAIDKTLVRTIRSDSLYQSELEHFPGQAVLPEPGFVAVGGIYGSEPASDRLDTIQKGILNRLLVTQLGIALPPFESGLTVPEAERQNVEISQIAERVKKPAARAYQIFKEQVATHPDKLVDVVTLVEGDEKTESLFEVRLYTLTAEQKASLPKVAYQGGPTLTDFDIAKLKQIKAVAGKDNTYSIVDPAKAQEPTNKGKGASEYAQFIYALGASDRGKTPLSSLLMGDHIIQGQSRKHNFIRDFARPLNKGDEWRIIRDKSGAITKIEVFDFTRSKDLPVLELSLNDSDEEGAPDFKVVMRYVVPADGSVHTYDSYYNYSPRSYALVHEYMPSRNERISAFYREVMRVGDGGDDIEIGNPFTVTGKITGDDIRNMAMAFDDQTPINELADRFQDSEFTVNFNILEQNDSATSRKIRLAGEIHGVTDDMELPQLNAWVPVIWEAFFKSLFAEQTQGDLFALKHLVASTEIVKRDGKLVVLVEDEVNIEGNYALGREIETVRKEHVTRNVELKSEADVAVLKARPWFKLTDGVTLEKGDVLRFETDIDYTFYFDKTKKFNTTGKVYRGDEVVGTINSTIERSDASKAYLKEDLVEAYLKDYGKSEGVTKVTDGKGSSFEVEVDFDPEAAMYAVASSDYNPLHHEARFASLSNLSDPITHGMYTYGMAVKLLAENMADSEHGRVLALRRTGPATFMAMVPLGARVIYSFDHTGNKDGNAYWTVKAYIIETKNGEETRKQVFEAEAIIAPPRITLADTGQGSASLKMYEAFKDSPAAMEIINDAYKFFSQRDEKGVLLSEDDSAYNALSPRFDLKNIVQNGGNLINEDEIVPSHGARKQRFEVSVGGEILSKKKESGKDMGFLELTQFQQVALSVYADAATAMMREAGVLPESFGLLGNSLGEYNALGRLGVLERHNRWLLVYQRGLTMQNILSEPQFKGKEFRMLSVKPFAFKVTEGEGRKRTERVMKEKDLEAIVAKVKKQTDEFIQVVNYNATNSAYGVAGTRKGVEALQEYLKEELTQVEENGASILNGILVPFHSLLLLPGVSKFRDTLDRLFPQEIDHRLLVGQYLPNFTGEPFALTREYVQKMYDRTKANSKVYFTEIGGISDENFYASEKLVSILDDWDEWSKTPDKLARALVVELLAYQFAAPVQFNKSLQTVLRGGKGFEKSAVVIEVGAAPHVKSMVGSEARVAQPFPAPQVLSFGDEKDRARILSGELTPIKAALPITAGYAQAPVEAAAPAAAPAPVASPASVSTPSPAPAASAPAPQASSPVATGRPAIVAGAKAPAEIEQPSVDVALKVLLGLRFGKNFDEIKADTKVSELSGGVSTEEIGSGTDIKEEFKLDDVGDAAKLGFNDLAAMVKAGSAYKAPGKMLIAAYSNYVVKPLEKLGVKDKDIKAYLIGDRMLPPNRMMDVMAVLALLGKRGAFAGGDGRALLQAAVDKVSELLGVGIPDATLAAAAGGGAGDSGVSSKALEAFEKKYFGLEGIFAQQSLTFLGNLGVDWPSWFYQEAEDFAQGKEDWIKEHITWVKENPDRWEEFKTRYNEYAKETRPIFDKDKIIELHYDWADVLANELYAKLKAGEVKADSLELTRLKEGVLRSARDKNILAVVTHLLSLATKDNSHPNRDLVMKTMKELVVSLGQRFLDGNAQSYPYYIPRDELKAPKTTYKVSYDPSKPEADRWQVKVDYEKTPRTFVYEIAGQAQTLKVDSYADFVTEMKRSKYRKGPHGGTSGQLDVTVRDNPNVQNGTVIDEGKTEAFLDALQAAATTGVDYTGKVVWLSGASKGSIAESMMRLYLAGGATVVLSHYGSGKKTPQDELDRYKAVFKQYGRGDSNLFIVPMNQGSKEDIGQVETWMRDRGLAPDIVVPFGSVTPMQALMEGKNQQGKDAAVMDMMINGPVYMATAAARLRRDLKAHGKATLVAPLSPNVGTMGGDYPYGITKKALEALYSYMDTESALKEFMNVAGGRIGWVNTSLMKQNAMLSEYMEKEFGVRTFVPEEMAFILAVLSSDPVMKGIFNGEDAFVDATGGFEESQIQAAMQKIGERIKALQDEKVATRKMEDREERIRTGKGEAERKQAEETWRASQQANMRDYLVQFPKMYSDEELAAMAARFGIKDTSLNLDDVVVIVGYGEVSPFANSRIRWEYETRGELTVESAIELARIMGLIEWTENKKLESGQNFTGWWDISKKKPIADFDVKKEYEKEMLEKSGIRLATKENAGFDPRNIVVWEEKTASTDNFMSPAANEAEAREQEVAYKAQGFDKTRAVEVNGSWFVALPQGAPYRAMKRLVNDRFHAGLIPDGWKKESYGLTNDVIVGIDNIDPLSIYALVSTVEALFEAGITDPAEIWNAVGLAKMGQTIGSGMGGMKSLKRMFQDHKLGQPRYEYVLQETLINVVGAWVNQAILHGYGGFLAPVEACETSAGSMSAGVKLIRDGQAKMVTVGGFDDFGEEGNVGFADFGATVKTTERVNRGIVDPKKMPMANSPRRAGFTEAQGGGIQHIMKASDAIKLGLPIYGIVALAESAQDGAQASIPAPGQGLLRLFAEEGVDKAVQIQARSQFEAALAVFGLTIDDVGFWYRHDTSTGENDHNETRFGDIIMRALGRKRGNKLAVVSQKNTTGHAKGGAYAWMLNGLLQALRNGVIPGNRNLDDLDPEFIAEALTDYLLYPDETLRLGDAALMAGIATSFGFGHAGGLSLIINGSRVLMALTPDERAKYYQHLSERQETVYQKRLEWLYGKGKFFDHFSTASHFEGKDDHEKKYNETIFLRAGVNWRNYFDWDADKRKFVRNGKVYTPLEGLPEIITQARIVDVIRSWGYEVADPTFENGVIKVSKDGADYTLRVSDDAIYILNASGRIDEVLTFNWRADWNDLGIEDDDDDTDPTPSSPAPSSGSRRVETSAPSVSLPADARISAAPASGAAAMSLAPADGATAPVGEPQDPSASYQSKVIEHPQTTAERVVREARSGLEQGAAALVMAPVVEISPVVEVMPSVVADDMVAELDEVVAANNNDYDVAEEGQGDPAPTGFADLQVQRAAQQGAVTAPLPGGLGALPFAVNLLVTGVNPAAGGVFSALPGASFVR